jgi:hypothetical protein
MKQKLYRKLLLLSFLGLFFYSCQYEEDVFIDNRHNHETSKYKISKITLDDVKQNPQALSKLINPKKDKSLSKLNHKIINDTINNFSIDTEIGTFIESENYHSYTFKVIRPNGSNFLLENLVLSKEGTNDYIIYLYQYDLTEQELQMLKQGININIQDKVTSTLIDNPNLATDILAREYPCFVETATWVYGTNCSGNGHHAYGEECPKTGDEAATPGYIEYSYVLTWCNDNGGDDFSNTNAPIDTGGQTGGPGSNTGTGNNGTNPDYDPTDPNLHNHTVVTTPTDEFEDTSLDDKIECDKIKNMFIDNPELRDNLLTLDGLISESTERGKNKLSNSSIIQNAGVSSDGQVKMPDIPNNVKCTMMAHTHNSPANSTYSIFSWEDLATVGELLNKNKIDETKFVMFLATADGTRYAFTINDATKLKRFFAIPINPGYDINIYNIKEEQRIKYYYGDDEIVEKIKENSTDLIADEKAFLDLLQDNDIGVTLFEVDAAYTIFEKVVHNKTNNIINKTNCN